MLSKEEQFMCLIRPVLLHLYSSLVGDTGEKRKGKDSLPFEKYIFRKIQPVSDDDRILFEAITVNNVDLSM